MYARLEVWVARLSLLVVIERSSETEMDISDCCKSAKQFIQGNLLLAMLSMEQLPGRSVYLMWRRTFPTKSL